MRSSMEKVRILELKKTILENNDEDACLLRRELAERGIFAVNVMSSPGAGKTTTLLRTIEKLKDDFRIGVMEADIDSDVDALKIREAGIPAVQLHTGGMCHLDAQMTRQGLAAIGASGYAEGGIAVPPGDGAAAGEGPDLIFLENVGNLVCPAEFDTGCSMNVVIYSVPEGDDKPQKYPLMFEKADAVLINKIDAMPVFDFDMGTARSWVLRRNPNAQVFPVSARTGEGFDEWCSWLKDRIHG